MFKLGATILKDLRILIRDKVGLTLMFVMPIFLVLIITSIQNSTFELVNESKMPLLLCNKDTGSLSKQYIETIRKIGMFDITQVTSDSEAAGLNSIMHEKDALIAIIIPSDFSASIRLKSEEVTAKAIDIADSVLSSNSSIKGQPILFLYNPVLQQSFRQSIEGALNSALQIVEGKQIVQHLYFSINEKNLPESLEHDILNNSISITEIPAARDGSKSVPNSTQHNVPAWTIFAMFFIVISLGSSIVREKLSGSFVRLKTLPTSYIVALFSKQVTYLGVTMLQVIVIFSLGIWLFPSLGLPKLELPHDIAGLIIVSLLCGWCAVSYAICIGTFAKTQEQANGFGSVSIVILAAIGGILVPSFAMPQSFSVVMKLSPLYWCLESYYGLFLERGSFQDILKSVVPLITISLVIQSITLIGLKRKNLI
jgi:ABC-2 type transport system permease protein